MTTEDCDYDDNNDDKGHNDDDEHGCPHIYHMLLCIFAYFSKYLKTGMQ